VERLGRGDQIDRTVPRVVASALPSRLR
jgi:hypothetical protein